MNDLWQQLREKKALDDTFRSGIVVEFGTRGTKALDAIDRHLVKKYLDFFVVSLFETIDTWYQENWKK